MADTTISVLAPSCSILVSYSLRIVHYLSFRYLTAQIDFIDLKNEDDKLCRNVVSFVS